jgi:hypothetical protein
MNLKKLLKSAVRAVKANPEIALAAVGLASPKLVAKVAPIIIAAVSKPKAG